MVLEGMGGLIGLFSLQLNDFSGMLNANGHGTVSNALLGMRLIQNWK